MQTTLEHALMVELSEITARPTLPDNAVKTGQVALGDTVDQEAFREFVETYTPPQDQKQVAAFNSSLPR